MHPMCKHILLLLAALTALPGLSQDILINEVMYSNRGAMYDADGDTPDWIELYNAGVATVDLAGWSLSDEIDNTPGSDCWTFGHCLIAPDCFLLIFLSGKDKHTDGEIHADFRIASGEEPVLLLKPSGEIADIHPVKCVPAGLTGGRQPDGAGDWLILDPSPGTSNAGSAVHEINIPEDSLWFSHPSGFYPSAIDLEIRHLHPFGSIRYTLDGSLPNDSSSLYEGLLHIDGPVTGGSSTGIPAPTGDFISYIPTCDSWVEPGMNIQKHPVLRARVMTDGCPSTPAVTATYFIENPSKDSYDVPIVSLVTDPENLFDEEKGIYVAGKYSNYLQRGKRWERPVHLTMFDNDGMPVLDQVAGARIHGFGSREGAQKSLRLYAREEYGEEAFVYPFFADKPRLDTFRTLILRTVLDRSGILFKEELCHHLVRDMEVDYMAGQTVIVFINGEYWGIHSLRERQDEEYIRMNHRLPDSEFDIISHHLTNGLQVEEGSDEAYLTFLNVLSTTNLIGEEGFRLIDELVDINNLCDYYIAELYFANGDFPHNNYKMWREKGEEGKWNWLFFDCDVCMIRSGYDHISEYFSPLATRNDPGSQTGETYESSTLEPHDPWTLEIFRRILQNKIFREHFYRRMLYHINNTFTPERVINEIDRFEKMYRPIVAEHIYRWNQPNEVIKWSHNVSMLRTFAIQRAPELLSQFQKNMGNPLEIHPNPSNGQIRIAHPFSGNIEISISSLSGSTVYNDFLSGFADQELYINTGLAPGMYILRLEGPALSFSEKLIIN